MAYRAAKAAPIVSCGAAAVERSADREAGRKRDTDFLAAPVSGNPKVVSAGKLSLAVSGPQDTFTAAEPLPTLFGARVTYVGDDEVARTEDFATFILEQARRSGITLPAENVKVDDGLEAL
jgi:3-hydroxyisobutyrate dehydrogenase-like beta-hydroxyacid dehydrogenase